MNETPWRNEVIEFARRHGWLVSYIPNSVHVVGDRGVPDLVLARAGVVLLVELKGDTTGSPPATQRRWLRQAGSHGRLWRPADREQAFKELAAPI